MNNFLRKPFMDDILKWMPKCFCLPSHVSIILAVYRLFFISVIFFPFKSVKSFYFLTFSIIDEKSGWVSLFSYFKLFVLSFGSLQVDSCF